MAHIQLLFDDVATIVTANDFGHPNGAIRGHLGRLKP
jgi:hypothetical protein